LTDDQSADEAGTITAAAAAQISETSTAERRRLGLRSRLIVLTVAVVFVDILALFVIPPYPPGQPGESASITDFIQANLEFPEPHVVWAPEGSEQPAGIVIVWPSISNTILTMWLISAVMVVIAFAAGRRRADVPGRLQNFVEWVIEALSGFAESMGGPRATRYVGIFMAFFLFILLSNWSGLLPVFRAELAEYFRAPTSDLNITIGLALVSFVLFHVEGVRALGARGYLGKFFPVGAFRQGVGAGAIALFVGLIELMLEFVKPVTLSMRLFGNIYGGEVALGVLTALTLAVVPVAMLGLEIMLNFIQALIFSVLTLMFTMAAIEGHHADDEGHAEAESGHATPAEAVATN
jgi:F-type H+-transporting ATPase subunit a